MATKTSNHTQSALRAFAVGAIFIAFLMAPAAQALRIDFDSLGSGPTSLEGINITLGGHAAIVKTVILDTNFQAMQDGPAKTIRYAMQTIEFVDGPVTITRLHLKNLGKQGFMMSDASWISTDGSALSEELTVRKITRFALGDDLTKSTLQSFDLTPAIAPTNPVPEPGAALLFAAGLTATATMRRRR